MTPDANVHVLKYRMACPLEGKLWSFIHKTSVVEASKDLLDAIS